jgi:hypothetical protein
MYVFIAAICVVLQFSGEAAHLDHGPAHFARAFPAQEGDEKSAAPSIGISMAD